MAAAAGSTLCTYATTGTTPIGQRLYECHTCGLTEANGSVICVTCAAVCHSEHHVVYKGYNSSAYCDCGSSPKKICKAMNKPQSNTHSNNSHSNGYHNPPPTVPVQQPQLQQQQPQREFCSFATHGTKAITFPNGLYECVTCTAILPAGSVVCPLCAKVCHAGHVLRHMNKSVDATCDCGAEPKVCRCLPVKSAPPAVAVVAAVAPLPQYQPMQYQPLSPVQPVHSVQAVQLQPVTIAGSMQNWAQSFIPGGGVISAAAAPPMMIAAAAAPPPQAPDSIDAPPPDFVEPPPDDSAGPPPAAAATTNGKGSGSKSFDPARYASVEQLLRDADALDLLASFISQEVDLKALLSFNESALRDLIPKVGPRSKVAAKLDEYRLKELLSAQKRPEAGAAGTGTGGATSSSSVAVNVQLEMALGLYSSVISHALEDGKVTLKDEKMLDELRAKYNISMLQHSQTLHKLAVSDQKWTDLKKKGAAEAAAAASGEGSGGPECVVCLDARADHIILPCAHICLCVGCAAKFKKDMPCPKCRTLIARVAKTFSS